MKILTLVFIPLPQRPTINSNKFPKAAHGVQHVSPVVLVVRQQLSQQRRHSPHSN